MMEGHLEGTLGKQSEEGGGKIRFATVSLGFHVMQQVWPHEHHVWTSGPQPVPAQGTQDVERTIHMGHPSRVKRSVLEENPVDVLLVDVDVSSRWWMSWVQGAKRSVLPSRVVVMCRSEEVVSDQHTEKAKEWFRQLEKLEFHGSLCHLSALEFGGAIDQHRLVYVFSRDLPWVPPRPHDLPIRPMQNLLRDHLVPRQAWAPIRRVRMTSSPSWEGQLLVAGRMGKEAVYDPSGPMPDQVDAWVKDSKRVRRLQASEVARALGVEDDVTTEKRAGSRLTHTTGLHLWTALGESLSRKTVAKVIQENLTQAQCPNLSQKPSDASTPATSTPWAVPDLSHGGKWYNDRVASLKNAVHGLPRAKQLYLEGLEALEVHRTNYTSEGPKRLQLLWWEFPEEHQEAIREGSSMNFLVLPTGELVLNGPLLGKQLDTAAKFVDQLISLGVLEESETILANCPLFCVPKPAQEDEWRCIADMKRGGQNQCCCGDPVYLCRSHDLLNTMYTGGYSAVADQSKYFHNYLTRREERPFMGTIHPKTGRTYVYRGLPMGSSNSPAIACRCGNAFMRLLRSETPAFQGVPVENSWRLKLQGKEHRLDWGQGRVLVGQDGLPACHIWAHVDDYLIHGPTLSKTTEAFHAFMDLSVRLGFIVQPCKTSPPAQVQKYCGFEYDTTQRPVLRIPRAKQDRAIASIDYVKRFRNLPKNSRNQLARLTLAVVLGRLQSLVDATPQRVGQAYLRRLYTEMHVTSDDKEELQHAIKVFGSTIILSEQAWKDLEWWRTYLLENTGVQNLAGMPGATAVTWGDGSGTGGGGTFELVGDQTPCLEFWMGTWAPHVASFSSNWKELRTLVQMLEKEQGKDRLSDGLMFYFTDNLVTYYIVQSGSSSASELHKLVRRVKQLALQLKVRVEVVHVPGKLMIRQGADGLSRGIRVAHERIERSTLLEASRVLADVPFSPVLMEWAIQQVPNQLQLPWVHISSLDDWSFKRLHHFMSFWTPTPEMASQAISSFLLSWCEKPTEMGAVFCVPRVMQKSWGHMSKHVQELGVYMPEVLPPACQYESLIPVVLLYVAPYVRVLPPDRVESSPNAAKIPRWIQAQADDLRGMC